MGISITGYSDVEIKPVPEKYRAKINYTESLETKKIMESLSKSEKNAHEKMCLLSLIVAIKSPDVDVSDDSYEWCNNNKNIFYVEWSTNMAYYIPIPCFIWNISIADFFVSNRNIKINYV
jgi:hypothetical protein